MGRRVLRIVSHVHRFGSCAQRGRWKKCLAARESAAAHGRLGAEGAGAPSPRSADLFPSTARIPICTVLRMSRIANFVTLHPYFKVHSGKLEIFKAGLADF